MGFRAPICSLAAVSFFACALVPLGCSDPSYSRGPAREVDAGYTGPEPLSVAHCSFETPAPTASIGSPIEAGAVSAGTAEVVLDMPIGSTLGAYASRANLGGNMPNDGRQSPVSGRFQPSIGIETAPRARVLALKVGAEELILIKLDLGVAPDGLAYDVAQALGAPFAGKVVVATGHSHAAWGHLTSNAVLDIGFGVFHADLYDRLRDQVVAAARTAISSRISAKIAMHHDGNFDPLDYVSRDRRGDNDALMGGKRKDRDLFVLRVDSASGAPIAVLPIFGVHGTVLDGDNNIASRETSGAIETAVEEAFDSKVLVMHLQGAAGDVSPAGKGTITCTVHPCYNFARVESVGREARASIMAAWENAGPKLVSSSTMHVLTRSIVLGPDAASFAIRGGKLSYAPFDLDREPDGIIYEADGKTVKSPIDEFNAPAGAALCGEGTSIPARSMPGVSDLAPYSACVLLPYAHKLIQGVLEQPVETTPLCATTRTVVSAIRLGDFLLATLPGEPVTLLADTLRSQSPYPAERTAVVGYAQSHMGYLLTPEDWLSGGFEPSINVWGPLEGEHILEGAASLLRQVVAPSRANGETGTRVVVRAGVATPTATASTHAGTVPAAVPENLAIRSKIVPLSAEPAASIERLQSATFVFEGSSPLLGNPASRIEREVDGVFVPLTTRSGRAVSDGEVLMVYTPFPLTAKHADLTHHYYVAEWQAVMPRGIDDESYAARTALPLGRYRFSVSGPGISLTSRAFNVTAAALTVQAKNANADVELTAYYNAAGGYRLLDDDVPSNGLIPARARPLAVQFMSGSANVGAALQVSASALGVARVAKPAGATRVRVRDAAGNEGAADLP